MRLAFNSSRHNAFRSSKAKERVTAYLCREIPAGIAGLSVSALLTLSSLPVHGDEAPSPKHQNCATTEAYARAKQALDAAAENISKGDYPAANRILVDGISAFGMPYDTTGVLDDTGLALSAAAGEEHRDHLTVAVNLRLSALRSRLWICERQAGQPQK